MSDRNPIPPTKDEARAWLAAFEAEFQAATETNSILNKSMQMVEHASIPLIVALKLACIELCRRNAEYAKHINLSHLKDPTIVINLPKDIRLPEDGPVKGTPEKPLENAFTCETKEPTA